MTEAQLQRWSRWILWFTPVISTPFRHYAIKRLVAERLNPKLLPTLLGALRSNDRKVASVARAALGSLHQNQACVDALCACWAKDQDPVLAEIIASCRYQAAKPMELWASSGLLAGRMEEIVSQGAKSLPHVITVLEGCDRTLTDRAWQVLSSLANVDDLIDYALKHGSDELLYIFLRRSQECVEVICARWAKDRDPKLAKIITSCRCQASQSPELFVWSGLLARRTEEMAHGGTETLPFLMAALEDKDQSLSKRAWEVLAIFANTDALIDYALDHAGGEVLHPIIRQRGLRHSVEGRWFLYLVLAGRFDEYLAEDFEFQTLRAEFAAAPAALQGRIRESIVQHGDIRMNPLFVAERKEVLLANLSDADAEALVRINARNRNWETLFSYLWVLPARHGLEAIRAMQQGRWQPEDADRAALWQRLTDLAGQLHPASVPQSISMLSPVLEKWLTEGATGELSTQPAAELRKRLREEVPPPEQIAALGALRHQKALTPEIIKEAGLSAHWMVRMVAVHHGASLEAAMKVNDGGLEWFRRLATLTDAAALWNAKPCHVTRDGREALQEHLARLPDRRAAGGLNLVAAIVSHYTAHDIEVEIGARVTIEEDAFEIAG